MKLLILTVDLMIDSRPKDLHKNNSGIFPLYNTTYMLGVVDKNSCDIMFCKPYNTYNPLIVSGILNDIDTSPKFFPTRQINDSTLVM
jgi:hypothetical protein